MNVPVVGFLLVAGLLIGSVRFLMGVPRIWRGDLPPHIASRIGSRSYEGARVRAAVRLMPVLSIWGVSFFAMCVVLAFVDLKTTAAQIVMGVAFAETVVVLILMTLVQGFDWPKRVIPPIMREGE